MTVSILLADDHAILRQGLRALLDEEPDLRVVGEAEDGLQVLNLVETLRPNIVVLDLEMPGLKGLEALRQIIQRYPHSRVVILSMHAKEAYVVEALKNGASAYVLKGSDTKELIHAIRQAMQGNRYLSQPLTEHALESYIEKTQEQTLDPYDSLTNRERQILHMAAEGWSSSEIAEKLVISARTVEVHRARMMHKLGLHSQVDLVRFALRKGILSMEE